MERNPKTHPHAKEPAIDLDAIPNKPALILQPSPKLMPQIDRPTPVPDECQVTPRTTRNALTLSPGRAHMLLIRDHRDGTLRD